MKHPAPGPALARAAAEAYLPGVRRVERVLQGTSTYVYRADTAQGVYFLRDFCWRRAYGFPGCWPLSIEMKPPAFP